MFFFHAGIKEKFILSRRCQTTCNEKCEQMIKSDGKPEGRIMIEKSVEICPTKQYKPVRIYKDRSTQTVSMVCKMTERSVEADIIPWSKLR